MLWVHMANSLETLSRYMRVNVVIVADSLNDEFAALRNTIRRWRENGSNFKTMPVTDSHLCTWKANKGPESSALIYHAKAGPAWLALAKEAIKGF